MKPRVSRHTVQPTQPLPVSQLAARVCPPRTVSLPGTRPQAASKKCQLPLNAVTNLSEIYYYIFKKEGGRFQVVVFTLTTEIAGV